MLMVAVAARANSIITWGLPQAIFNDNDVSTVGTLVGALKLGSSGVSNATVSGIAFLGVPMAGNSVDFGNFTIAGPTLSPNSSSLVPGPFGLSASYQSLLSSVVYGGLGSPIDLTMNGLAPGVTYQFQWWSSDNNGSGTGTKATAGNSVVLDTTSGAYGPALWLPGQFATGTFVADGTRAQTINFSSAYFTGLNAFQLRQISEVSSVPDASNTILLLALGLCSLNAMRRNIARHRRE
jgi:hypothetical protein